jgi:hypothetical protein
MTTQLAWVTIVFIVCVTMIILMLIEEIGKRATKGESQAALYKSLIGEAKKGNEADE